MAQQESHPVEYEVQYSTRRNLLVLRGEPEQPKSFVRTNQNVIVRKGRAISNSIGKLFLNKLFT